MSRERAKEIKRLSVISTARQVRLLSRAELTELTGLSPATLTPLVRELIAEGYLIERGPGTSRAGRPRAMLEFNPRAELVAAVALEPARISCEIADSDGNVVAHRAVRLTGDIVDTICRSVPELAGDGLPALRGVAIAAPGVSSGGAVRLAPSVGLVEGRPIGESVQRHLGVPVVVDNDVNLMAAGEHAAGAGSDVADLLLLHVADGIGAGLVLDGQVRRGAGGAAGEVGFLPLDATDRGHDGIGPFEARWSENAIAERVVALAPGRRPDTPVAALVELARTDERAGAYLDELLRAWSRLIVSCVCVIDPGRVLLSGAAAQLDDAAVERLQHLVSAAAPATTEVRRAVLGDRAVLHGAVSYALAAAASGLPTLLPSP
ncbi:transcriptional regulator [Micromonospora yangpuensis]|uniref:Sugar kinase of the NBD/HSP70 family, may contain an N-terminal HTH domain n=1 Tax=Micromonospora yangpuensis TaxID=683228 RepID=A0A1C6V3G2_9ACTN|nr:transcriptional regulator [Micromonospora yangpuensis]SCL60440.1 Sugar kinase of the NBD/HSP70 family, may contain an N-terminal HTH domain [Micromonospora yangpuensis]